MRFTLGAAAGERVRFVYFWKNRTDGVVDEGCFSQWSQDGFEVDGVRFATAEHYMMWRKATLFGDHAIAEKILAARHPHQVKKLGGRAAGFDEATWREHRFGIVVAGNLAKFGQRPDLRDYLVGTGDRVLVEASPLDRIWGIGLTRDDAAATDPKRWRGLNLLGFALMEVRATLSAG